MGLFQNAEKEAAVLFEDLKIGLEDVATSYGLTAPVDNKALLADIVKVIETVIAGKL
jgi:hypothetical protein